MLFPCVFRTFSPCFWQETALSSTVLLRNMGWNMWVKQVKGVGLSYTTVGILHPILHPKSLVNTMVFMCGCRKCRFFSKTFFWGWCGWFFTQFAADVLCRIKKLSLLYMLSKLSLKNRPHGKLIRQLVVVMINIYDNRDNKDNKDNAIRGLRWNRVRMCRARAERAAPWVN